MPRNLMTKLDIVPDLLLVLLLPLLRLLLGHLEGLQVLANHAKLFLQVDYLKGGDTGFT